MCCFNLRLNCLICRWYKFMDNNSHNKKQVRLNERVKQVGGTLIIKEAKVEDSGKYLCMVNNSVGGESVETVLTVTGYLKDLYRRKKFSKTFLCYSITTRKTVSLTILDYKGQFFHKFSFFAN